MTQLRKLNKTISNENKKNQINSNIIFRLIKLVFHYNSLNK